MPISLREAWGAREVLVRLILKDLTVRYRQTAGGVSWVILQPLLGAGIFSVVFGVVAHVSSGGVPYLVFSYAGLTVWTLFSGVISRMSVSLVANAQLVTKVYFPRVLIPLGAGGSALVDFAVASGVLVPLMAWFRITPGWSILTLPLFLVVLLAEAVGAGLIAAPLAVRYRDVQYALPVAIQFLLFATPIAYSLDTVPGRWRLFFIVNPLSGVMDGVRWALFHRGSLDMLSVTYSVVAAVLLLMLGLITFARMEKEFADVI